MFVLIRVDSLESRKIILPVGSHVFGRGQFLDVDDKELKVSKTHGQFDVTQNSVTVVSTHTNPCFIQREGLDQKLMLTKNNNCTLAHGDKIGLLPDSFWYKLVYMSDEVDSDIANSVNASEEDKHVKDTSEKENGHQINEVDHSRHQHEGSQIGDEFDLNAVREVEDHTQIQNSPSILASRTHTEEQTFEITNDHLVSQTLKRCHSTVENDNEEKFSKLIKAENNEEISTKLIKVEQEPSTSKCGDIGSRDQKDNIASAVKTEADTIEHTPEKNEPSTNDNIEEDTNSGPSTPLPPQNAMKERCMYGANCYRRNPQHKAQYSHPGEEDWGAGERGVCPWGARCRRRNPRHWRDHSHPPGTHAPAPHVNPQPARKKLKKRDNTREVSPVPFDDLPAKRSRKATVRPSWSGSESENEYDAEDPFLTDGSDEWLPSDTEYTESQDYSQCD